MAHAVPAHPAPVPSASGAKKQIAQLAALTNPHRFATLQSVCSQLTDISGVSPSEIVARHGGGLVLVEQGVAGYDQIVLTLAVERPSTAVIVVSDHLPTHMVRALMKLEASDILPASASITDVMDAAERLRATMTEKQAEHNSVCWALRGAVGGAGVSTLAIEMSFEMTRRAGRGKVCLVDLNVSDGMITSFLDCVPKLDLSSLSKAPERLDRNLMSAWCHEHESGLNLIAAQRNPDADSMASDAAILRLLDVACSTFDVTIVDMPRHMMPWTKSVLAAVDEAIIVSELTVPSLHAAADMCRDVDIWRGSRPPSKLILNRMFAKKRFRSEFAVDRAEKAIERKIDATVTSDWDAARTAVNLGKPIAEVKPKSALVADVHTIVGKWIPANALQVAAPQKKRARP